METPEAVVHPSKVWKQASFRSWVELSVPSKIRAFLSRQMPHIKQWGIMFQTTPFLCLLNLTGQLDKSSITPLSITKCTPKRVNTMHHNSLATGQHKSKWLVVSPALLHIQHQLITRSQRFCKLSFVKIRPNAAVQMKKLIFVGKFGSTLSSKEKTYEKGVVRLCSKIAHHKLLQKTVSSTTYPPHPLSHSRIK